MAAAPGVSRQSRLVIHVQAPHRRSAFEAALHRLRARCSSAWRQRAGSPIELLIDDLQGQRLCAIHDAGPLTELPLPPGTYHVTALQCGSRRGYTMALLAGESFDLYLQERSGG